jgi:hypothetical protein
MTAAAKILPPEVINGDSSWSLPIAALSQHEQARELPPSTHQPRQPPLIERDPNRREWQAGQ